MILLISLTHSPNALNRKFGCICLLDFFSRCLVFSKVNASDLSVTAID